MRILSTALVTAAVGLIAATGGTSAYASTPTTPVTTAAFVTAPAPKADGDKRDNKDPDKDRDKKGDDRDRHNGDRDRDRYWDHDHDNDWVSADQCRDGGGHVDWDDHRCWGGRFDGFHVWS